MTEPPLQTNKVWAVMLYSNSGDVIGGVRTAPHLFRTREQAMAEAIAWFPDQTFAWQRIEDDFYTAKLPNHTAYVRSWLLPPEKIFRRGKCRGSLNDAANNPDSR